MYRNVVSRKGRSEDPDVRTNPTPDAERGRGARTDTEGAERAEAAPDDQGRCIGVPFVVPFHEAEGPFGPSISYMKVSTRTKR